MTMPDKPEPFRPPARLAAVPEHLMAQATRNISALVGHDSAKADEVVRRVLAALHLADPKLPDTQVYHYPDSSLTDAPMGVSSGALCQWGKLRRGGDVLMCALDEYYPDGEPGPGHDTPGEHAFRLPASSDHVPFHEDDPRAFHAPTWLGEDEDPQRWATPLRAAPQP